MLCSLLHLVKPSNLLLLGSRGGRGGELIALEYAFRCLMCYFFIISLKCANFLMIVIFRSGVLPALPWSQQNSFWCFPLMCLKKRYSICFDTELRQLANNRSQLFVTGFSTMNLWHPVLNQSKTRVDFRYQTVRSALRFFDQGVNSAPIFQAMEVVPVQQVLQAAFGENPNLQDRDL